MERKATDKVVFSFSGRNCEYRGTQLRERVRGDTGSYCVEWPMYKNKETLFAKVNGQRYLILIFKRRVIPLLEVVNKTKLQPYCREVTIAIANCLVGTCV